MYIENDLIDRLRSDEKVTCIKCKQGIYQPVGTSADKAHGFSCDKCGDTVLITPNVTVE